MSTISSQVESRAVELFGSNFKLREGQLEAIEAVVANAVDDVKHTVLEAPTGSGKSVIALLAAYVLHKDYEKKSYILVSDLSLFDQYANEIDKLGSPCFGYVKGKENYICNVNQCKVSQSTCSLQGMSILGAVHSSWHSGSDFRCAYRCKYAKDYMRAVRAPITLMTYQLYFIQRNYVEDYLHRGKNPNFPKRDLVICDECHKICEICQAHFAPQISIERPSWMQTLDSYAHLMPSESQRIGIVGELELSHGDNELLRAVKKYEQYVSTYCYANASIRAKLAGTKHLSKSDRAALAAGNMARQEHCKLEDMLNFAREVGSAEFLVKTTVGDSITINFVFDGMMLKKYLHKKSGCELMMSATIGDFTEYAMLTGMDTSSFKTHSMKSTFDFSKSPIYLSQDNKMSAALKDVSIEAISKQVASICEKHSSNRGIIQTGSYANSLALKDKLPPEVASRCVFYNGTDEKKLAIDAYADSPNAILVGPTLVEGLDFPDDICRFQICIKVPYAYLGSEYVKKKMKHIHGWYEYDAITKICQGIGRGIRHKDDWCETYILDGCIMNLANKLEDIPTLSHRFKLYE